MINQGAREDTAGVVADGAADGIFRPIVGTSTNF